MKKYLIFSVMAALLITVWLVSCKSDKTPTGPDPSPFTKASDWVAGVDWDTKTVVTITMVESGAALSYSPDNLTFEAGKPYVLKVVNPAGNASKHYFSTQDMSPDFYKSIATRKIETAEAEYKAPYFKAVELLIGGELDIYFVPVLAGTYDFLCTITGHAAAGMTGKITITGGEGYELDLEVDPSFDTSLITDPRTSGSHAVWSSAEEITVQMVENADGSLAYNPSNLNLTLGKGYKINIENASGHASKHYYTAAEFYKTVVTRKAEDDHGEIKMPYLKAVELLIGGKTELFMVPTKTGSFEVFCTITGHKDAGMKGLVIVVEPPAPSPFVNASDWVAGVDWDAKTVVTMNMVESGSALSFDPNNLTFEAGKPYVLKVVNPAGNAGKHYFATEEVFPDFYKSIATRKIQTPDAEYKAPYFRAVELLVGGELEIYFVPVLAGTYDFLCTITGHADAGMTGEITITGGAGYELDLEVDPSFDMGLTTDARTSGSHDVWSSAQEVTIEMVENDDGSLAFNPDEWTLTQDFGYKINLENSASNVSKHYYTAAEFYKTVVTRKAEDSNAEIKVPYFKAIELLIGGKTELFMVPTSAGTYDVLCTIPGHDAAGMHGHLTVQAPSGGSPWVNTSDWVANADWDSKTEITMNMVESGGDLSFSPNRLTLTAGKPYVLKIVNAAGNTSKHYFATEGAKDFFQAVATRKIQTADAEYKAPYFKAVELLIGGALEIYFIPVLTGNYDFLCTITGHAAAGMTGKIVITGGAGYELDLEVDPGFDTGLITDPRTSGSHAVWATAEEITVNMVENADGSLAYDPATLNLTKGNGYKIHIVNASGHASKHYYTASEFYKTVVTRKAEDGYGEIKMPYMKAVELLIGGQTELFMVPTVSGSYEVFCTITGHRASGMEGLVVVVD